MDIWFTSDHHFFHQNIIKYENRPFIDVDEMNTYMIKQWNDRVKQGDLVFHLGDLFFGKSEEQKNISKQLNGRKILIRGNHDVMSKKKFNDLGFNVYNYYVYENFLLSHRPQQEEPLKTLVGNTNIIGNVHGHVHSKVLSNNQIYCCVCVENWNYQPVHIDEVYQFFKQNNAA